MAATLAYAMGTPQHRSASLGLAPKVMAKSSLARLCPPKTWMRR